MLLAIRLDLNWKLTAFTLLFLPLLISLGFWQLNRAKEKTAILENWSTQKALEPVSLNMLNATSLNANQPVSFNGEYIQDKYWLQEGKIYQGRPGYNVIMPVKLQGGGILLVNRGWVMANPDRRILPEISTPNRLVSLLGYIQNISGSPLTNEKDNPFTQWPHRILELDLVIMGQQIKLDLLPSVVSLNKEDATAFVIQSKPVNMPPEKHHGYAVQWFGLSIALAILWIMTNTNILAVIKLKKEENDRN